jgi:uncharacterized membrane protein
MPDDVAALTVGERESPLDVLSRPPRDATTRAVGGPDRVADAGRRARAEEQLRQEREAFEENKRQIQSWARLRLVMGWTALVLLVVLCAISIFVIALHDAFPASAITAAAGTVFLQTLALVVAVWRLVLGTGPKPLAPLTRARGED